MCVCAAPVCVHREGDCAWTTQVWLVLLGACGMGLLTVYANIDAIKRNAAVAKAAGEELAIDRQVSLSVDNLTTGGLPLYLFSTVLLWAPFAGRKARVAPSPRVAPSQSGGCGSYGKHTASMHRFSVKTRELVQACAFFLGAGKR